MEKLSSYAFNNYFSDAYLYNGIHDLEKVRDALVKAVEETLEGLPSECSCHPAYREREKNLGYRFKDPECLYCDMESDIKGMLAALKLAKGER